MAKSGIEWIDYVFDWCVILLIDIARVLGITYEEINVWLFCIILPIVFYCCAILVGYQNHLLLHHQF